MQTSSYPQCQCNSLIALEVLTEQKLLLNVFLIGSFVLWLKEETKSWNSSGSERLVLRACVSVPMSIPFLPLYSNSLFFFLRWCTALQIKNVCSAANCYTSNTFIIALIVNCQGYGNFQNNTYCCSLLSVGTSVAESDGEITEALFK